MEIVRPAVTIGLSHRKLCGKASWDLVTIPSGEIPGCSREELHFLCLSFSFWTLSMLWKCLTHKSGPSSATDSLTV